MINSEPTIKIKVQPPKSLSFNGPLSLKDLLNPQQLEEANYNSSQVHEQE
jgi:hypothetical protein